MNVGREKPDHAAASGDAIGGIAVGKTEARGVGGRVSLRQEAAEHAREDVAVPPCRPGIAEQLMATCPSVGD